MALLTAAQISSVMIELLTRSLVLPMTCTPQPGGDFSGPNGASVTVRLRVPRTARTQATPGASITFDAMAEVAQTVTLAHKYNGTNLTDEDLTLNLEDYAMQIGEPLVSSITDAAEEQVAAAMNGLTAQASFATSATEADTRAQILTARQTLTSNKVPLSGRYFACSPQIATRVLSLPEIIQADQRGDGGSALREAVIGRAYGFTFVESGALTAGQAVAYHRSGFVFANRTPVPANGVDSSAQTVQGVGLRAIRQYNPENLSEQDVVSTYIGAAAIAEDGDTATNFDRSWKMDTT